MFMRDPKEPREPFREPELRYGEHLYCSRCQSAPPEPTAEREGDSCPCGGTMIRRVPMDWCFGFPSP